MHRLCQINKTENRETDIEQGLMYFGKLFESDKKKFSFRGAEMSHPRNVFSYVLEDNEILKLVETGFLFFVVQLSSINQDILKLT